MLTWSVRRRVFYLTIAAVLGGGVLLGVWWQFKPIPSCFDGRQNQNEVGVDCGGLCARVCFSEVKDLRVVWTRVLAIAPGQYDAATLVVNPNRQHGTKRFGYVLRLLDRQGILITTKPGEAYLNPGESFIIYNSRLNVGQRAPDRAIFEIVEAPIWQRVEEESPDFTLRQRSFANAPFPSLVADIKNETLLPWQNIEVVALLADADGNAFAVSSTLVDQLDKQGTAEVAFTWPQPFPIAQPVINFYTHVNLMGD